jgi:coenzyme PQQ precursor peptide PqqA
VLSASAMQLAGLPSTPKTTSSDEATAFTEPRGRESFELTRLPGRHRLAGAKTQAKEMAMKWKTPVIIEIAVGLEINAYACAEVK